jgi:predicted phosphodiesterase
MQFKAELRNVDSLSVRHTDVAAGWEQSYLLISDVHFDSPHCNRKLLTKHLNQAKAKGAGIFCIGDWFDAMGGRNDKRGSKSSLRVEDKADNYFDLLVDHSAEYLSPYAGNFVMMGNGNHETSILKHGETDVLKRLCRELGAIHMGYSGFVRFQFRKANSTASTTRRMHFHHGSGGGGPVTKAMIGNNRKEVAVWADIFVGGHIHVTGYDENEVYKCNDGGTTYLETQYLITIPGYKQEYTPEGGFHIEGGRGPKPQGGWWMNFRFDEERVRVQFVRAD